MKNEVYINAPMLNSEELDDILKSRYSENTEFELFLEHGFMDPCAVHCVFVLVQSIGLDAAYDLVKYVVFNLLRKISGKNKSKTELETKIKVDYSEKDATGKIETQKTVIISTSFKMDQAERERIINGAIKELLSEKAD